ncbi:MAG: KGG domain-containing protein [bacterium]|nr:KGG domain-containing protein [bacterium]
MAGTKAGGAKAAATNKEKYGADFYSRIGQKGGQNGTTGGFAANRELAVEAGRKGGRISRRGPAKNAITMNQETEESVIEVRRVA